MKVRPGISHKGVPFLEEKELEAFSLLYLLKSNIGVSIYFLYKNVSPMVLHIDGFCNSSKRRYPQ
jgi:hypothetical protein